MPLHAIVIVSDHELERVLPARSEEGALHKLRTWYRQRLKEWAVDDQDRKVSPKPKDATVEQIAEWYSEGSAGYMIEITSVG
jgi:hypothetical protein